MSMKQQAEINKLNKRLEELEALTDILAARVDELEEKTEKRGPGRPKKVANG